MQCIISTNRPSFLSERPQMKQKLFLRFLKYKAKFAKKFFYPNKTELFSTYAVLRMHKACLNPNSTIINNNKQFQSSLVHVFYLIRSFT